MNTTNRRRVRGATLGLLCATFANVIIYALWGGPFTLAVILIALLVISWAIVRCW